MASKAWQSLRQQVLERDGHRCCLCGSDHDLAVHHILHRRGHQEHVLDDWNLVTVCTSCHWQIHRGSLGLLLADWLAK